MDTDVESLRWAFFYTHTQHTQTHSSVHVPAAESLPEGMQSGQLLQARTPAAGEGTGEQQPHHSTETEGRLRSGRCNRCGKSVCLCICA